MTNTRPDLSLSRVELVVLSRLSAAKPPSPKELAKVVDELALPNKDAHSDNIVNTTIASLRQRGLMSGHRLMMTEAGTRALKAAFELDKLPLWKDIHTTYLLAHALGLIPNADATKHALKDATSLSTTILRSHFKVDKPAEIADKLIAETVGLPSGKPVTIANLRSHVLAKFAGLLEGTTSRAASLKLVEKVLGEPCPDKRAMARVIIRRWVYAVDSSLPHTVMTTPRAMPIQPRLPLDVQPSPPSKPVAPPESLSAKSSGPIPTVIKPTPSGATTASNGTPGSTISVAPLNPDGLLAAVRDAIPRIGADGRFGPEKVFVSALWSRIERDGRMPELSIDRFKNWLVTANRDQLVDLARADVVGAMDPKLVSESEIRDRGATFHFVVDRRTNTSRGSHAR